LFYINIVNAHIILEGTE